MYCKKFKDLDGCGKCTINLSDPRSIRKLTPVSMAEVVDIVLNFCTSNPNKRIILHISTIDCRGNTNIFYAKSQNKDYGRRNRVTCKRFIKLWYDYNKVILYQAVVVVYLSQVSHILNSVNSDTEAERQATELNKMMDQLLNEELY